MSNGEERVTEDFKSEVDAALAEFSRKWAELPPLVRAGKGISIVRDQTNDVVNHNRCALHAKEIGLERRSVIELRFKEAAQAVLDLFAALTQAADREAVSSGVDVLATGDGLWLAGVQLPPVAVRVRSTKKKDRHKKHKC